MKDIGQTPDDVNKRIQTWMFLMIMRLYGQNIYSDESYVWRVFDLETVEDVDTFFENVLGDFKYRHRDISRLYKILQKQEDILSR